MANQDRVGRLFRQASGNQKTYLVDDDKLAFVDPDDTTKRVRLDAGAVTTATTRTLTLPDRDITLGGGDGSRLNVIDTGGAYATPIVLTTAQSGRTILSDDAAGLDFTLPAIAAVDVGTWYEFLVSVTITSNNLRVTAASGDLLRGGVSIQDFDTANTIAYFTPDESDDLIFTMNGTTKGGKKGSRVRFIAITATGWFVEGHLFGDGTLATPFA